MKTQLLFLLLFLGGLVFFGCKKNNALPISAFTGTYLVSGTDHYRTPPPMGDPGANTDHYLSFTNDSLIITMHQSLLPTIAFSSPVYRLSFTSPPLSAGNGSYLPYNDPNLYYNYFYPGETSSFLGYTLSYQKNNVDTIYVHAVFDANEIFLSGVKVHQ